MWVKVDDGFPEHHKVLTAGEHLGVNGAGRVAAIWLEAMCYANRHLTDGFIKDSVARRFHLDKNPVEVLRAMALKGVRLVARVDGGWTIHDYHDYQPSKAEIEEKRRKERDRKRKRQPDSARKADGIREDSAATPQNFRAPSEDPDPARSDPARPQDPDQEPPATSTPATHPQPIPMNSLGQVRFHLMAACHALFEDTTGNPNIRDARGELCHASMRDELKVIARRDLNAEWDFGEEINRIFTAVEKTREKRMAAAQVRRSA